MQVNVALFGMLALPQVMNFLAPASCVQSSSFYVMGILIGMKGVINVALWMLCIPGLFDMLAIQYMVRTASPLTPSHRGIRFGRYK